MSGETVSIDMVRCAGHGMCAVLLPEHVSLDAWGYPKVADTPLDAPDVRRARRAARACPRRAVVLSASGDGPPATTVGT